MVTRIYRERSLSEVCNFKNNLEFLNVINALQIVEVRQEKYVLSYQNR